jgi:hypothetical protein
MTFSARTERRGQTINQLAAEKRLHKIIDKSGSNPLTFIRKRRTTPRWPLLRRRYCWAFSKASIKP